jgi:U3 small nucleolar RNA-associated protein 20
LLIEVIEKRFLKHTDCIIPVTCRILQSAIHAVTNRQEGFESESTVPLWKEAYYSLVMIEKMIRKFNHLCFEKDLEVIFLVLFVDIYIYIYIYIYIWTRISLAVHGVGAAYCNFI